jgi:heme-degrading monooxygenase HmoA
MFARVTRTSVAPERAEEAIRFFRAAGERIATAKGIKHAYLLTDRERGVGMTITFWERHEDAEASRELGRRILSDAEAVGVSTEGEPEVFEVAVEITPAAAAAATG